MLRPRFDSILLMAASTFHGIPYVAPALRQSCCSRPGSSVRSALARSVQEAGSRIAPGRFGVSAVGTTSGAVRPPAAVAGSAAVIAPVTPAATAAARAARARRVIRPAGRGAGPGTRARRPRRRGLGLGGRLRRGRLRRGPLREPVLDGALLRGLVERDEEVVPVRSGVGGGLAIDLAGDDLLDQGLREGLHLEELALGDRVDDLLGAVLADEVGDAGVVDHHLDRRDPAAVDLREQALRDHAAEDAGHDRADLRLLDRPGRTRSSGRASRRRRSCASSRARGGPTRPPGARSAPSPRRGARR